MKVYRHDFKPLIDKNSRVLILGSFPSVKSREEGFYYGHPQNRFWKLMAILLSEEIPISIDEKRKLILNNHLALYDAAEEASIKGSLDSNLKVLKFSNIMELIDGYQIEKIFCNGSKSHQIVTKNLGLKAVKLPSTSAANAKYSLDRLIEEWKIILEYI
ncbi:MAG: DNA-deoxyinosine glycosylase [Tissierellia bacterium]|nr:DNA-deoxyinosine glycosylase [Tissierellia bacterium]